MPQSSQADVIAMLAQAGVTADVLESMRRNNPSDRQITSEQVRRHEGDYISISNKWSAGKALAVLQQLQSDEETRTIFSQSFERRPDDVFVAAAHVMTELWGMALGGSASGFGPSATMRTVQISRTESVTVPDGMVNIPALGDAEIYLQTTRSPDYGTIGHVKVRVAKMYRADIDEFFRRIKQRLVEHSIYKGHVLLGADSMDFQDVTSFDETEIVLSESAYDVFNAAIWGAIRYAKQLKNAGVGLKRAALLFGGYGCGKTSGALITAKIAQQYGMTTIFAKPDDDIDAAVKTAALYAPSVLVVEDVDTQANDGDPRSVKRMLDLLDGPGAKGREIIMILTTNKPGDIHEGLLRPGRLDFVIKVDNLDQDGVGKLIRRITGSHLADDVDWAAVFAAANHFSPAFVRATCDRAITWGVVNGEGADDYQIGTTELVAAAQSLRPQLVMQGEAGQGVKRPALDAAFSAMVEQAAQQLLERAKITGDYDAEINFPAPARA